MVRLVALPLTRGYSHQSEWTGDESLNSSCGTRPDENLFTSSGFRREMTAQVEEPAERVSFFKASSRILQIKDESRKALLSPPVGYKSTGRSFRDPDAERNLSYVLAASL